jgi:hypothetical protein
MLAMHLLNLAKELSPLPLPHQKKGLMQRGVIGKIIVESADTSAPAAAEAPASDKGDGDDDGGGDDKKEGDGDGQ